MTLITPPGWLQNAGAVNTAQHLRNYSGSMLMSNQGSLQPAGGVNFSIGGGLRVVPTAPESMAVNVLSGIGWIPGTEVSLQGAYAFMNDGQITLPIDPADPSQDRVDLVVARIRDSQYSGAVDSVALEVINGIPAEDPVFAAVPPNSLPLAGIYVGVGATSIADFDIVDRRWWIGDTYTVRKPDDEVRNNVGLLVADADLHLPVSLVGGHYAIDGWLFYDTTTTADIRFDLVTPSTAEVRYSIFGPTTSISSSTGDGEFKAGFDFEIISLGGRGTFEWLGAHIMGSVEATALGTHFDHFGDLVIEWCQNSAEATDTRVTKRSWLRATRIPF